MVSMPYKEYFDKLPTNKVVEAIPNKDGTYRVTIIGVNEKPRYVDGQYINESNGLEYVVFKRAVITIQVLMDTDPSSDYTSLAIEQIYDD